ncbi:MAG: SpoVG family protein [candidate division KSB1 bacterium]|jgi:stage V sporulation protein G|nr:SpoVG family protein [candidate division KSB1 bacterium]
MEITEINITLRDEEKLKAFVNVTFDDIFVVRGMKVIKGGSGYFISMPSRKMPDGTFRDIAHPITNEFRQFIEEKILERYHQIVEDAQGGNEAES